METSIIAGISFMTGTITGILICGVLVLKDLKNYRKTLVNIT